MPAADRATLQKRWNDLCTRVGFGACDGVFDQLLTRYTGSDRHYHDIGHIEMSLRELDAVRDHCENADAVELAIWFHDCVYDGRRLDNEERSADVARAALAKMGADPHLVSCVVDLILATRHVAPPAAGDQEWLVDIDLAPLGAAAAVFDANGESIRREYAHLDDATYARARSEILERFLERPSIYATEPFASRYEQQARSNLARSLGRKNGDARG
ncbi:MAG TPA: hypothetical protein VF669_03385 [Tepidisphaeraceae bacterium]|jgi:predicted metal-dependent HD superfamily phosphohydrolase